MREIKFRAYDKENRTMHEVIELNFNQNGLIDGVLKKRAGRFYFNKRTLVDGTNIDDVVLMQYTGLKDKNGKEIYEGDVIEFVWEEHSCWGDEGTYKGYVQHDDGGYEVVYINRKEYTLTKDGYKHPNSKSDELQSFIRWTDEVNCEVIGNIYENPELLLDEDSICYGCQHYTGGEDGCNPPNICIEGSLNKYITN